MQTAPPSTTEAASTVTPTPPTKQPSPVQTEAPLIDIATLASPSKTAADATMSTEATEAATEVVVTVGVAAMEQEVVIERAGKGSTPEAKPLDEVEVVVGKPVTTATSAVEDKDEAMDCVVVQRAEPLIEAQPPPSEEAVTMEVDVPLKSELTAEASEPRPSGALAQDVADAEAMEVTPREDAIDSVDPSLISSGASALPTLPEGEKQEVEEQEQEEEEEEEDPLPTRGLRRPRHNRLSAALAR